ncbi:MAG: hypothetical protein CO042_04890 [Parcubacteria group bacterium CG_4_9_14_0_2_um_filter_41_8]|nr:MAG: hypothetical protein COW93_01625 [Parcubacteria group bacterium CG22_combo_CG10-13_8_21_14_all_41_9]PJC40232.1 MAG: hypothetical protein CO042_04890 [Parcubacteria group bacterium CG_4_9_14_0_2_um_filter_41_8]
MYLLQFATTTDLTATIGGFDSAVTSAATSTSTTTSRIFNIGEALGNLNSIIAGFDFSVPTWDLFIILFFLLSALVYGLILGRDRIILMLISIYIGLAVLRSSPFLDQLIPKDYGPNNVFLFKISLFIGVFVVLFFFLSRSSVLKTLAKNDAPGGWLEVIVFSLLQVGLLISITLSFISPEYYNQLSSFTRNWFLGPEAEFFWIVAPIVAMALLGRGNSDD